MTNSGELPVTYTYDLASRLRSVGSSAVSADFEYDALGRRTQLMLSNGLATEYQYDRASRLTALVYRNAAGLLGGIEYGYDAGGNRVSVKNSLAGTLLPEPVLSASYDASNQQLSFGSRTNTFDDNGNLTSVTESGGTTTFLWDARNRLVGVSRPSGLASFDYDVFGRRVTRTLNGGRIDYVYDGPDIIQELREGAAVSYFRTLNIDEPLARNDEFYLADALGSITALTDALGVVRTRYTYEPFGRAAIDGAPSNNPFQFTGREAEVDGLHYYRVRYYDSSVGRFISEDPIGYRDGPSLYTYVLNNPLKFTDPFGLQVDSVSRTLAAAIRRGSVEEIKFILESSGDVLSPAAREAAQAAIRRLQSKAGDIIARECVGKINRVFPEEMREKTLEEIFRLAREGVKAVQTAKKLLTSTEYLK